LQQTFLSLKKKTIDKLTLNQKRFVAEVLVTFIVVVLATGAVVIDAKFIGVLGMPFIAFLPFMGVAVGVYLFGKISMAHFNPAVTLGFLITKHITKLELTYYFTAEILGALLESLFVMVVIGNEANLGANSPNYAYHLPTIFGGSNCRNWRRLSCFGKWIREKKGIIFGLFGGILLFVYGIIPTLQTADFGRVYAAYGGIFIVSAIVWGILVDKKKPDKFEVIGSLVCILGAIIIFYVPR
jgi:drug/metabolite transporter superfamily protein YnfA